MPCFVVTYDLHKEKGKDYTRLYDAIKAYGTWAKITESTWAIVTDEKAKEIRDNLLRYMHSEDRLFVVKSGVAAAWHNVKCSSDWLKEKL